MVLCFLLLVVTCRFHVRPLARCTVMMLSCSWRMHVVPAWYTVTGGSALSYSFRIYMCWEQCLCGACEPVSIGGCSCHMHRRSKGWSVTANVVLRHLCPLWSVEAHQVML
jgi:hypothetical protein